MKLVFTDAETLGEDFRAKDFEQFGEVMVYNRTEPEEMQERCQGADILVTNKNVCKEATLGPNPTLKMIAVTATGTNIIDLDYARAHSIAVANVKGYSTESVAQHTFALLFYLMEKCSYYDEYVKSEKYIDHTCFTYFHKSFSELSGKTWGIVGLGDIGRRVAQIAQAFGCKVIYYSTTGKNNQPDFERVEFGELLSESDIISIHAPLTPATEGLFGAEAFSTMKSSAILINVGRGPIVDEQALCDALESGEIAGAGLDVLCVEPMAKDNPLRRIKDSDRLFITPHIAWATTEARARLMAEVSDNIKAFLAGERRNRVD